MDLLYTFAIQRTMKTEKLNIHNSTVSVKTSLTEVICNATTNNISRPGAGGFFYAHTRSRDKFTKCA